MRVAGYEFRDSAVFQTGAGSKAPEVGAHLEMLRVACKGELTPADVLADAKNPNSPLHSFFEWDDGAAAEAFRLDQARNLIRSVVAVYVDAEKPATRVRAFIHINEPGAPHYRSADHVMSVTKTREMVLQRAWREFQQWRKRYEDLAEFASLFSVADEVAEKLPKVSG